MKTTTRVAWLMTVLTAVTARPALSQSPLHGYVFGGGGQWEAPGRSDPIVHAGAGVEGRLFRETFSIGTELGFFGPTEDVTSGVFVLSPNAAYYFKASSRLVPFVTGGYSMMFRSNVRHAGNIGGGLEYWVSRDVALRFELRDHIRSRSDRASEHFWAARAGLTFR